MEGLERLDIYKGKRVLVTGHTGFKGAWMCIWLNKLGAEVVGVSSKDNDNDHVYIKTGLSKLLYADEVADVREYGRMKELFDMHRPEIVFHLAAQPLVRLSYDEPVDTLHTNIMGTLNVLECVKQTPSVKAGVMITTDKCYKNKERVEPYSEEDELGGHDPYSCSKACAELVIDCYRKSFFKHDGKLVASVRAGNVIGGGDFSQDRLIPDCIRSLMAGKDIEIRNPSATRPWQFVIEPLYGYLIVGKGLLEGKTGFAEGWNFGPELSSVVPVSEVVDQVIENWGSGKSTSPGNVPTKKHEAKLLSLCITKAKSRLNWEPKYDVKEAVERTVEWYKKSAELDPEELLDLCDVQISDYCAGGVCPPVQMKRDG
ncbi:CDP-glucose 4,6-dehydratase [Nanoarchaeota archaeon]